MDRLELSNETTDGKDLLSLLYQYSDIILPNSDWLTKEDVVIINEASVEGIKSIYHITVQQHTTTAIFDTSANMSVISQKFFDSLPQQPKLLASNICTVMSANGTELGLIGHCYLTFQLKMHFTDKFIVLWNLWRDLILGLNWLFTYRIGCNWNINGYHYITHNNTYLCTSIPLSIHSYCIPNLTPKYKNCPSM